MAQRAAWVTRWGKLAGISLHPANKFCQNLNVTARVPC